jgi:PAS domain S-box-containing protein
MAWNSFQNDRAVALRRTAEMALLQEPEADPQDLRIEDARRLLHELRVHQIELELQNDELRRAQRELDEARLRYLDLYELAPAGYITLSPTGLILDSNLAASALLGIPRSGLRNQHFERFIEPGDHSQFLALLKKVLALQGNSAPGTSEGCELRLTARGGKFVWVSLQATLSRKVEGTRMIRIVLIDRTAQKVAENETARYLAELERTQRSLTAQAEELSRNVEQLQLEKARAEAATKSKSAFLSAMSHELRTPMNGVLGMTELLLDSPLSQEQRSFAETVSTSARALLTLLNDILDLAKIEAGKIELESMSFDLFALLEDVQSLMAEPARDKGLDFMLWYAADAPRQFLGDPGRIRQIVLNLCSNAIKFTDIGHVLVECGCRELEKGKMAVRIAVIDTGAGIPPERQGLLFQNFQQIDSSTTRKHGGTGLGLAICKQLAQLMGGTVGLMSEPGVGSTFFCEIPLCRPEADEVIPPIPSIGARGKVLIAGHSPLSGLILKQTLGRWGIEADQGDGGEYRAIVLDGGAVDLAELRGRFPRARILRLGKDWAPLDEKHCDVYLMKPVREQSLYAALKDILKDRENPPASAIAEIPAGSEGGPAELGPRVLVVEDNAVNRRVASAMLSKLGCRVDVAVDGMQACAMAEKVAYDLILMDCMMPVMDGYDATSEIRKVEAGHKDCRHVPVVALTASAMEEDRLQSSAVGMDDFLTKPVSLPSLRKTLEKWVHQSGM